MEFEEKIKIEIDLNRKMKDFTEEECEMLAKYLGIVSIHTIWGNPYIDFHDFGRVRLYIDSEDNVLDVLNSNEIKFREYNPDIEYRWGKLEKFKPAVKTYTFEDKELTKKQILEILGD